MQGWFEPDVERDELDPDDLIARARVVMADDPAFDILAFVECKRGQDGTLIGQALLRTAQDVENTEIPLLVPLWPGDGHTGQPRASQEPRSDEQGVVRFLARGWPVADPYSFPFWCIDQESFPRPADAPPPDRGWFACDGQIANIDVMPATIDIEKIALGCLNEPTTDEIRQGCPTSRSHRATTRCFRDRERHWTRIGVTARRVGRGRALVRASGRLPTPGYPLPGAGSDSPRRTDVLQRWLR